MIRLSGRRKKAVVMFVITIFLLVMLTGCGEESSAEYGTYVEEFSNAIEDMRTVINEVRDVLTKDTSYMALEDRLVYLNTMATTSKIIIEKLHEDFLALEVPSDLPKKMNSLLADAITEVYEYLNNYYLGCQSLIKYCGEGYNSDFIDEFAESLITAEEHYSNLEEHISALKELTRVEESRGE